MKVFLDTNVWLSATIFSGLCEELTLQCAERDALLSSALVRSEAHEVLRRKFGQVPNACELFDASWRVARLIADVDEPVGDNDKRLVAAAAAAGAYLFVTGDKRVLSWREVPSAGGTMRMVTPRDAWPLVMGMTAAH
jgi:predicted nucleic acid-binding protein